MADTLIDSPPETLPDIVLASPPPAPAPVPPPRRRGPLLAVIIGGLVAVALACAALLFYLLVWRYEPTARRHIPGNANVAIRVEATDVLLFGPVRKHLWPLLEEPPSSTPAPAAKP